jgi:hypothetical protein
MKIIPKRMKLPVFMLGLTIIDATGLLYRFWQIPAPYMEIGIGVGAIVLFASIIIP